MKPQLRSFLYLLPSLLDYRAQQQSLFCTGYEFTATTILRGIETPSLCNHDDRSASHTSLCHMSNIPTGGTLLIAFLVYAMYRLHKGAAFSDVVRFRTRQSILSYGRAPREARRFTSLPIHRESHFSMRSSYHKHSATSSSSYTAKGKPPATPPVSEMKKQCWKTAHPPSTPKQTTGSFLVDATPPVSLKEPAKARVSVSRRSSTKPPSSYQPSLGNSTNKSRITFAIREASPVEALAGTPPDSPTSVTNAQDRWSWTNSQAPTTPRLYAPESRRSSSTPMPRFQTVSSWIDTQPDSIAEENDAKAVLKKQASKSSLASSSPKKLSKSDKTKVNANHGRMASLTSMFRQHSVNKAASPPLPKAGEKARADKGNTSARRKS